MLVTCLFYSLKGGVAKRQVLVREDPHSQSSRAGSNGTSVVVIFTGVELDRAMALAALDLTGNGQLEALQSADDSVLGVEQDRSECIRLIH